MTGQDNADPHLDAYLKLRKRVRLEKERQHYENALQWLVKKGDDVGAERLREQLADVDRAIADVDYRAANVRAMSVSTSMQEDAFEALRTELRPFLKEWPTISTVWTSASHGP